MNDKQANEPHSINYYQLLGVDREASDQELREAYVRAKDHCRNGGDAFYSLSSDDDLKEYQELIELAYFTLIDEKRRINYNNSLSCKLSSSVCPAVVHVQKTAKPSMRADYMEYWEELYPKTELSLGKKLMKLREYCQLSITDIWRYTKLNVDFIRNLESDRYSELPALVYTKGLLKTYLQFYSLTHIQEFLTAYTSEFNKNK